MPKFKEREEQKKQLDALKRQDQQVLGDAQRALVLAGQADSDANTADAEAESADNVRKATLRGEDGLSPGDANREYIERRVAELETRRDEKRAFARAKRKEADAQRAIHQAAEEEHQRIFREMTEIERELRA